MSDKEEGILADGLAYNAFFFAGCGVVSTSTGTLFQKVLDLSNDSFCGNLAHAALGGAVIGALNYVVHDFMNAQEINFKLGLFLVCSSLMVGNLLHYYLDNTYDFSWEKSYETNTLGAGLSIMSLF